MRNLNLEFSTFFCLDLHCIPKHGKSGRTRVHCSLGDKSSEENFSAAAAALCSMESLKSYIFVENTNLTMLEVVNYSKQSDNMLRVSSPNSVSTFSNSQYYQQLCRM